MKIYPFRAGHLENLVYQPEQEYMRPWFEEDPRMAKNYEADYSFTLIDDEGDTLACAGLTEHWPGRAVAWMLLSARLGGAGMLSVVRAIRREFASTAYTRIEAHVDRDFEQGHRLMRLLGFKNETPNGMPNFLNGRTHDLYARVI